VLRTQKSPSAPLPRPSRSLLLLLLLTVGSMLLLPLMLSPLPPPTLPFGSLSFTDSGQYYPATSAGTSDRVTLQVQHLPPAATPYAAWLMADPSDTHTPPILLGRLQPHPDGSATLHYSSPDHRNLLAHASGLRITQQAPDPARPSADPQTWRLQGWLPASLLSHLRSLLSGDQQLPTGLLLWTTHTVAGLEICSTQAQSSWSPTLSDAAADLIHHALRCILETLDGPPHSLGLWSQDPPGSLEQIERHLRALVRSPALTELGMARQADGVLLRMLQSLGLLRQETAALLQASPAQLRQPQSLSTLNSIAALVTTLKEGSFDPRSGTSSGGTLWLAARIQQLATIPLQPPP
jgi:hypothetical protein